MGHLLLLRRGWRVPTVRRLRNHFYQAEMKPAVPMGETGERILVRCKVVFDNKNAVAIILFCLYRVLHYVSGIAANRTSKFSLKMPAPTPHLAPRASLVLCLPTDGWSSKVPSSLPRRFTRDRQGRGGASNSSFRVSSGRQDFRGRYPWWVVYA